MEEASALILDQFGEPMVYDRVTRETDDPYEPRLPYIGKTASGLSAWPHDQALRVSAFFAARRYLGQAVGQLPARVKRMGRDGEELVATHPVDTLFNWRANPELSPLKFRETMIGWAILHGNAVAEIERDAVGRAIALWPLDPDRVEIVRDAETGELLFEYDSGTAPKVQLTGKEVFHIAGYGDGPVGVSVVEYAAQSIGWARAIELFGASFFGNGLNPSGVVEGAGELQESGQKRLMAQWRRIHGGPNKAHEPLFLDNGMKWTTVSQNAKDSQFIESLQFQIEEQCRWVGAPPQKVFHLLRMTNNNVEHLSIEVVVDCVTPWTIKFEQEANYKLFGQNRRSHFLKLDLKGLQRGDFKSRQEGLAIQRRNGVINADDWAEIEDMKKPGKAAGGQKYIVEGNMTLLERAGEMMEPAAPQEPSSPEMRLQPGNQIVLSDLVARFAPEMIDV